MDGLDEDRQDDVLRRRIDQALLDAATDAARRTARVAAGGYFLLVLFLLAGAVAYQRSTNERLDSSEMRACERVQNQRERANVSEARQFLLLKAVSESPRASDAVKVQYSALARTTLYDPPTDCDAAVRHPGSYRRPPSKPFYTLSTGYIEAVVQAAKDRREQPVPRG